MIAIRSQLVPQPKIEIGHLPRRVCRWILRPQALARSGKVRNIKTLKPLKNRPTARPGRRFAPKHRPGASIAFESADPIARLIQIALLIGTRRLPGVDHHDSRLGMVAEAVDAAESLRKRRCRRHLGNEGAQIVIHPNLKRLGAHDELRSALP